MSSIGCALHEIPSAKKQADRNSDGPEWELNGISDMFRIRTLRTCLGLTLLFASCTPGSANQAISGTQRAAVADALESSRVSNWTLVDGEASECRDYISRKSSSNYVQIAQAFAPFAELKRGQFETTDELLTRREASRHVAIKGANLSEKRPLLYASLPLRLSGSASSVFYGTYNPDTKRLVVTLVTPRSELEVRFPGSKQFDRPFFKAATILLSTSVVKSRKQVLSNAFGARRLITDEKFLSYYWAYDEGPRARGPIELSLQLEPKLIRRDLQDISVVTVGQLKEPFVRKVLVGGQLGTVTAPLSFEEWGYFIHASPVCVAIFNRRSGEVLKAAEFSLKAAN